MINLFEYQNQENFHNSLDDLELFLEDIWNNREKGAAYYEEQAVASGGQPFLRLMRKTKAIRSNKYVGVIHYKGTHINLLPKIFYDSTQVYSEQKVNQIHNHILWWLSYCRKIKFPNYQSALDSVKSDFFEVLIYLFSKYTRELLNSAIYQQYEEVNRELPYIKGRLNINQYIHENLTRARWHKLNCTYDAFIFDNEFNRIIKYVTKLLFNVTTSSDNKKHLREILFILDEVSDVRATASQCERIRFNPMFGEFETVRDYCKLFLNNCISFSYKNDLKLFAFLLPMEKVFEDFVFGFIDKELESVKAKAQKSNTFLDEARTYQLRLDLWLKTRHKSLIADTKYKIIYASEKDSKKGIKEADLYQMLAYAIRFKVDEIILFYPNTIKGNSLIETAIIIKDTFADEKKITIKAYQIPIINPQLLEQTLEGRKKLSQVFEPTKQALIKKLEEIFDSIGELEE